jgi:hypothetical protein
VFVAAAVVLPYIAVVMANAVGSTAVEPPTPYVAKQPALDTAQRSAIPQPTPAAPAAPDAAGPTSRAEDDGQRTAAS